MTKVLNINCDLGEGFANDALIMSYIQSCNIACGGHFGDEKSIRTAIQLAKKNGVKIGAHPSFPDRKNFGRSPMNISSKALEESIIEQVSLFIQIAAKEDVKMHHVKLHGALYNMASKDETIAQSVKTALLKTEARFKLYTPPESLLAEKCKNEFEIVQEAFIDRSYQENGTLSKRSHPNGLIIVPELAVQQLKRLFQKQEVMTINGTIIPLQADTFCIHGDNPKVLEILAAIHQYNVYA